MMFQLISSLFLANLENVNTCDKAIQNDYISMLKENDIFRYQQQHPEQFRPFGIYFDLIDYFQGMNFLSFAEIQRVHRDSEASIGPNVSTIARVRRESDRFRNEVLSSDGANPRSPPPQKTKIFRLPQSPNPATIPGSLPTESKSLILAAGNSFH